MGYAIMIMAWSSGSLWIAGSDKICGYCERSEKRVTVNGVNSNAAGGFWAANCGFCRKCFAKCDNVFEENVGVRNDETEN